MERAPKLKKKEPVEPTESLESIETPEDDSIYREKYEKEILPLIRILKPDDILLEEYERITMDALFEDVKDFQVARGAMISSPEATLDEVRSLLNSKSRAVIASSREKDGWKNVDQELLKRSKIALLYEGDFGDAKKYFGDHYDFDHVNTFRGMTIREISRYLKSDSKITESDLEALMNTKFKECLLKSDSRDYFGSYGCCEKIPESMLLAALETEGVDQCLLTDTLKYAAEKKYSKELFKKICEKGQIEKAVKYINKFKEVDTDDIFQTEKSVTDNLYYNLKSIKESEYIDEEKKLKLADSASKKYLEAGSFSDFGYVREELVFSEDVNQEEIIELAEKGLIKFISNMEYVKPDSIDMVIKHFSFPEERLRSLDMQSVVLKSIETSLSGKYRTHPSEVIKTLEIFSIPRDAIQGMIKNSLPNLARLLSNSEFLHLVGLFDISPSDMDSEEVRSKMIEVFRHGLESADLSQYYMDRIKSMLENAPYLRDGYPENMSPRDFVFERLKGDSVSQESGLEKSQRLKNLQESFWVKENKERLPQAIGEILERFQSQYGKKGETLVSLAISAYGTDNPERFVREMNKIEGVLNKYDHDAIPGGAKVSMGIEYEVTTPLASAYSETSALGYKKDILLLSDSANIGIGRDAVHEIALKPNYNPYILMAEMKLLQDAGFLDLNFEKYPDAARGYHLSLVGDNGLSVNDDMFLLHNAMTMAQLTGVTAGKDVTRVVGMSRKSFEHFSDTDQKGERCEIKAMATDSVEQFEKAIITSHHAGVAIQLADKYLLVKHFASIPDSAEQFEQMLIENHSLLTPFETDKERDIVFEWAKLKRSILDAVNQHNKFFVDTEFKGFLVDDNGEYIETGEHINITRNKRLVDEETLNSSEFKNSIHVFDRARGSEFINALSHINNIFLKGPQGGENSSVNARAVVDTVKIPGYGGVMDGSAKESVFDNGGRWRNGYYYVQGASEEMIIHKAQIILNNFNMNMERVLATKTVKREVEANSAIAA